MSEVQEYLDKADSKLKSSILLYDAGQYGDSVATSYYVMFLVAKALLLKKGIAPKTHKGLIHVFSEEYVNKGEFSPELNRKFARTQTLRQQADYDAIDNINQKIAKEKIDLCKEFIKESQKFL